MSAPVSKPYGFTVVLEGVGGLTASQAERLYRRCRDATESEADGVVRVTFSRGRTSFAEAVHRAVRDLRACGLTAARIETDDLVSAAEIAERAGRSRESVRLLVGGRRGPRGFPGPVHKAGRFRLWRWPEVERWFASYEGRAPRVEDRTAVVDALNLILALRRRRSAFTASERRELVRLAEEEGSAAVVD